MAKIDAKTHSFEKKDFLYEGKAKRLFKTQDPNYIWIEYKNDLTAFNALKKGQFASKGLVNHNISSLIYEYLKLQGIESHLVYDTLTEDDKPAYSIVKKLEMIPLEVVVRNRIAGSLAKKMGLEEGSILPRPLVEYYYKSDALADPFLSEEQILVLGLANESTLQSIKNLSLQVNLHLQQLFENASLILVDFKIEVGKHGTQLLLADEISPDCARLWDMKTLEKMDKDRFRRDLGQVEESYHEVLRRLLEVRQSSSWKESMMSSNHTRIAVQILPRDVILDTAGRAVEASLQEQDFQQGQKYQVASVKVGKWIQLDFNCDEVHALKQAEKMSKEFLTNPLIEKYQLHVLKD